MSALIPSNTENQEPESPVMKENMTGGRIESGIGRKMILKRPSSDSTPRHSLMRSRNVNGSSSDFSFTVSTEASESAIGGDGITPCRSMLEESGRLYVVSGQKKNSSKVPAPTNPEPNVRLRKRRNWYRF